MGFEQLAALKKELAANAKQAAQAKREAQPSRESTAKPARPQRKPGAGAAKAGGAKDGAAKAGAAKAGPTKPVDPVVQTIGRLQKRFPQAFPKKPAPKVPLKIGILEDILQHAQELGLSEAELRDAIRTWCRGARYWIALVEGAPRLDLTGQPQGSVTQADARRAQYLQNRRPKPAPEAAAPATAAAAAAAAAAAPANEPPASE